MAGDAMMSSGYFIFTTDSIRSGGVIILIKNCFAARILNIYEDSMLSI
jgi:hypothetical protein